MNRHTRKMLLNIATGVAVAATAAVVLLPAAYAAPGTVTSNVNVRSGPGTNYAVVDTVQRGTTVDVQQCQGSWCYIAKPGPDGWVSASYLSAGGGAPVNPSQPGLSFGFQVGPNGPTFNFGTGPQVQPPVIRPEPSRPPVIRPEPSRPPFVRPTPSQPPFVRPQPPRQSEVCFYDRARYGGSSFCMRAGDSTGNLANWADRISSIENRDGLEVQVCTDSNFRNCRTYTTSASTLGDYDDYIVSIRIR